MPTIKINIYSREHPPPHIHVIYAEYEELIVIETLETYAGHLPPTQRKKVVKWIKEKKKFLVNNFKLLNPR